MPTLLGLNSLIQLKESKPAMHELNFKWRNQVQNRKNRRRAIAAGHPTGLGVSTGYQHSCSRYSRHVGAKQLAKLKKKGYSFT